MSVSEPVSSGAGTERAVEVAVVAFGYELTGLFDGQQLVSVMLDASTDDDVPALVKTLRAAARRAPHVIVIYAEWLDAGALRRLQTARAALDTSRVALVGSDLPPLAGSVLAVLCAALAPQVHVGRLVGGLPRVANELVVIGWLRSVSGLKRPSPSMVQHAASLIPRRGFGVQVQPEPFVRRLNPDREAAIALVPETMEVVIADRAGDISWVTDVVNPALGRLRLSEVDATHHGPTWWGTARLTEVVVYPADLDALAVRATAELPQHRCGWCDTRVATPACPFCGHAA